MGMSNRKPRVAVIGGGITGALTAMFLTEDGYEVTVLEKKAKGNGASSRSAAAIRQQFSTEITVRGMRWATRYYQQFSSRYECEQVYFPRGYLFLYRNDEQFQNAVVRNMMQRSCGLTEAAVLAPEAVKAQFPFVNARAICGATWCPTDGFLNPTAIYETAFERVERQGRRVVQNAEVLGVTKRGAEIASLDTAKGEFETDLVINATGIWSPQLQGALRCSELPINPTKVYLYFLRKSMESAVDTSNWPFVATESGAYCRPDTSDSNQLMLGWVPRIEPQREFDDSYQDAVLPGFHFKDTSGHGFRTWAELADWLPSLGCMGGLVAQTGGMYDNTLDHNPIIDYDPIVPNLIHAVGFSGHGVMHAPFTARLVKHLVNAGSRQWTMELDGEPRDISGFAFQRNFHNAEQQVL